MRVSVVGASGYTGGELVRLLLEHPQAELVGIYGKESAGMLLADLLPAVRGRCDLQVAVFSAETIASHSDAVFCALPHGTSATLVAELRQRGLVVFDLSADFRLRDAQTYARWYGSHGAPHLLSEAVYGLVELHREALRSADLVAVPGCYPTATLLALAPLVMPRQLVELDGIVVDAKSGISGAGKSLSSGTHYPEVAGGMRAYKVGGRHRHLAEIEEQLAALTGQQVPITFTPHLTPMTRGILATAYAKPLHAALTAEACRQAAKTFYAASPAVLVLEDDLSPDTLWVRGTNRAILSYHVDAHSGRVIAQAVIDNLVKGAAGQALQCCNVRFGHDELAGLRATAAWP